MSCRNLQYIINILIFLFFSIIITIKNSYYIAPLGLVIISLIYITINFKKIKIDKPTKYYIFSAVAYYLVALIVALINKDTIPSSFKADHFLLLSIPVLLLLARYSINLHIITIIFPISCIIYGITAIYNIFVLDIYRAFSFIHFIPAGAIIMTMVLFCITLGLNALHQKKMLLGCFTILAAIIGLIGNILTGSRGTWLIFPVAILLLIAIYGKSLKRYIPIISSALLSLIVIASFIPQSGIQERYKAAVSDITQYIDGTNKETSIGMRFELWKSALDGIREKPLLGWGKQGMIEKRIQQSTEDEFPSTLDEYPHTHNQFLEQTFYRGIIGLIVLIVFIYTILSHFIRSYKTTLSSEKKVIALLGIINIMAMLSFSLSDALLRGKEYAMFFYISNILFYAMLAQSVVVD